MLWRISTRDNDPGRQLARQDDVTVQQAAGAVGDGVRQIVVFDQDGENARNGPALRTAQSLDETRHQRKDAGAVALRGGGFAGAKPISRCACANASGIHHEEHVWVRSRKYSAIVTAMNAALTRWIGGVSEVATTTTLRARPSGPTFSSRNSRTSRPRSPISATTLTAASLDTAMSPSSTLLPTPLPAKMPTRWPRRRSEPRRWSGYPGQRLGDFLAAQRGRTAHIERTFVVPRIGPCRPWARPSRSGPGPKRLR